VTSKKNITADGGEVDAFSLAALSWGIKKGGREAGIGWDLRGGGFYNKFWRW